MTVHRLNTSVAAASGAADVLNELRDSTVEPTVLAAAGAMQACRNTHARIVAYRLQQLCVASTVGALPAQTDVCGSALRRYDQDNVTACGSNAACVATWTAKLNATEAKIAFQQDLARVCNSTVGDFTVDVDQNAEALYVTRSGCAAGLSTFTKVTRVCLCVCCVWLCVVCRTVDIFEDFASSLQFQFGTLSNGVSDLALALQQIKKDNGPNLFTGALLKTVSDACVPAGSAAYHFGVSACPALCPPSTRDA